MLGIEEKVAVVTGAGQGIGREIALALAEYGAHVAVIDINIDSAKKTAELVKGKGVDSIALKCDVGDLKDVERCVSEIMEWKGAIHFLVNNAGITRDNLLVRMSEEEWDLVLKVNLKGTFNFTKAVSKHMMKQRFGRIVNISSVIGVMGNAGQSNYGASKAGIIGFTKSVAKELAGRNITANAIAPGFISTPMTEALPEERKEMMRNMIPLGRFGTGQDDASVVLFLVSELADYVTGQVVHCDGGMVM